MRSFKNLFLLNLSLNILLIFSIAHGKNHNQKMYKKKITILTSKGGFGHSAACDFLKSLIGNDYDLTVINPFEEILSKIDFVKKISFNKYDGEQFYNTILTRGWPVFFNFGLRHIMPRVILSMNRKIESLFYNFLAKDKPDLLISVIPVINLPASNAAWKLSIPYLMITLDYDLTMWTPGMKHTKHKNITVTAADTYTQEHFLSKKLSPDIKRILPIGLPIRKTFFEERNVEEIKREWNIPADKPVVMLLMGGAGSPQTYHYFKKLAQFKKPIHLLVCIGRNSAIKKKLMQITCSPEVSYSCIPFTTKIPDLMAASDLLITKPGPGTVTEGMIMKLPMILDRTITPIFWENKAFDLIKRHHIGMEIRSLSKLHTIVEKMLFDASYRTELKQAFEKLPAYNFDNHIKKIIHDILQTKKCRNVVAA